VLSLGTGAAGQCVRRAAMLARACAGKKTSPEGSRSPITRGGGVGQPSMVLALHLSLQIAPCSTRLDRVAIFFPRRVRRAGSYRDRGGSPLRRLQRAGASAPLTIDVSRPLPPRADLRARPSATFLARARRSRRSVGGRRTHCPIGSGPSEPQQRLLVKLSRGTSFSSRSGAYH